VLEDGTQGYRVSPGAVNDDVRSGYGILSPTRQRGLHRGLLAGTGADGYIQPRLPVKALLQCHVVPGKLKQVFLLQLQGNLLQWFLGCYRSG
jgi:hypothetical protein